MAQITCPNCGKQLPEDAKNCPYCGGAIPEESIIPESIEKNSETNKDPLKTETEDVERKNPKWVTYLVLAIVVIAGIAIANGLVKQKQEEAAQAAREAEYQQRLEEERQQKKLKEERIRQIENMISGKSYSCSKGSLVSYAMRDELVYSFDRGGNGTFMLYWVSMAGYDLKNRETISWWINDDEELVVSHHGDRVIFTIGSGYIKANNGDKFYKE